jgi:hypothetical protein
LAPFALWLRHLWFYADLEPTGPVPEYRDGVDEITGIEVDEAAAALHVPSQSQPQSSQECKPIASTSTSGSNSPSVYYSSRATLLLETIGVVQLHFFVPPHLVRLLNHAHVTAHQFITVRIPRASWHCSPPQFTKLDVFCALCRELSSACVGNEAMEDWLICRVLGKVRRRAWEELGGLMKNVACRSVDIPYGEVVGAYDHDDDPYTRVGVGNCQRNRRSRRLHCYDPNSPEPGETYSGAQLGNAKVTVDNIAANHGGALILSQQDPDGCELGVAIWEPGDMSLVPSHTTLFHFPTSRVRSLGGMVSRPLLRFPPPCPFVGDEMKKLKEAVDAAQRCLF